MPQPPQLLLLLLMITQTPPQICLPGGLQD